MRGMGVSWPVSAPDLDEVEASAAIATVALACGCSLRTPDVTRVQISHRLAVASPSKFVDDMRCPPADCKATNT